MQLQSSLQSMNANDVLKAYKRWAPVYDATFGKLVRAGVKQATARANAFSGKLLEVGVGTGLALRHYGPHLKVTGIDLSTDMLELARKRVKKSSHSNIEALLEMDFFIRFRASSNMSVEISMPVTFRWGP